MHPDTMTGQRRPWRLRTRLALALLLVFLPVAALLVFSHLEDLEDRRETRVDSFAAIGETIAASVDGFTRDLESFALSTAITIGFATTAESPPPSATAIHSYFSRLSDSYGTLRAIFLTDLDGVVIGSAANVGTGRSVAERDYIKALQSGADSTWTGGFDGVDTGDTLIAHGRVVRLADGTPKYFLILAFSPEVLGTRLPPDLPADANVTLTDARGTLLFSTHDFGRTPPNISETEVFQRAHKGETALVRSDRAPFLPDKRYGAFVPVRRQGWVVGFTRPAAVVDGPLENRFQRDMAIIAALLAGGFFATVVIASRLSRPLSDLADAAGAIARGDQPVVPMSPDADVRRLEMAMETMSHAVAERERRLRATSQVLETLDQVGEKLALELNFDRAVASISHAAMELTQAEAAAFFYKSGQEGELRSMGVTATQPLGSTEAALAPGDTLVKRTMRGEVLQMSDLLAMAGPLRPIAGEDSPSARSALSLPVESRNGDIYGAFVLLHSQPNWFTDEHVRLAMGLSRRASIIVENARLYSESSAIQDELRRANQMKDEFIGLISHELRTPITTIYGGARLLHARRRHLTEEDVDDMIGSIEEESERLYRLVENLLALARAELSPDSQRDAIAVGPVVEQAVKQFTSRRPGRPVELRIRDGVPPALAEVTYVQQMIHNLVTNADKYSDSGLPIEVDVAADNGVISIRVGDHGPGVEPEEIDQIFESFYRSQRTAKTAGGKGLGLTVCKRLAEVMGGKIWAKNRENGGLEVGFTLPPASLEPEEEPSEPATPGVQHR